MKRKLNVESGRSHTSTSLPPLRTTRTAATHSLAARFRRRLGRAPLTLLALLALALTLSVREASAQGPPIVTTLDATAVFDGGATLNGYWDPNGDPMALAWFEWSGGSTRPVTGGGYVSAEVGMAHGPPLNAGTTYYFSLVAANQWGRSDGGEKSFTTPGGVYPPTLVTLPATEVTSTSATLNGGVDGGALVWFDWGTSTAYGNQTSFFDLGTGNSAVPFTATLAWLTPNTIYHFRVAGQRGMFASGYGGDQSFTTLPGPVEPQFTFTTNNGTITITGYYGPVAMTIPSTITGLPVSSIGNSAFYYNPNLTSVTIPNSVINIGDDAFGGCRGLTNVTLGTGVTSIGDLAFIACHSLASITIPDSVINLGYGVFEGCSGLTNITIPNSVTSIGSHAFDGCTSLARITIPDSVISMGDGTFYQCRALTNVTIGNSVASIGDNTFWSCSITSVKIPNSVTNIGPAAFASCGSLTNVTIGNGVTSIGDDAFYSCTRLTALHFAGNAPALGGSSVFSGDSNTTVYYLPGTTGWGTTFGGRPTALWFVPNPLMLTSGPGFGVQSNAFGFIISWATNLPVVVEACTNLPDQSWSPLKTNALTGGWCYFSDPQWANHPSRFYRLRSP